MRCGFAGIEQDGVQAHAAGAGLPAADPVPWPRSPGSSCQFLPAVGGAENRGVFHAGVDRVRIGERGLQVPDALELPGMRRAVVPLVRAGHAVVDELVADRLPRLAAVVGALDHLPEPAARLRRVEPVRIGRRTLHVIDLPAGEMGAADVPLFALAVRRQNECALLRADQSTRTPLIFRTPPVLCARLLTVHHPRYTEPVGQHAETPGPKGLLDRHADVPAFRQRLEDTIRLRAGP